MNKTICLTAIILMTVSSCSRGAKEKKAEIPQPYTTAATDTPAEEAPPAWEAFFDAPTEPLRPHRLCRQKLTGMKATIAAFSVKPGDYIHEPTAADKAFYFPAADIRGQKFVRDVQLRYNSAALLNRVIHSLEAFQRLSACPEKEPEEIYCQDTLRWIRMSRLKISSTLLDRALPDRAIRANARRIIHAYSVFDGHLEEGSAFNLAFNEYRSFELPGRVPEEQLDEFRSAFWDWYDKEKVVPGIDNVTGLCLRGRPSLTEEHLDNLRLAVEAETDIDKRTVLALEYAKMADHIDGAVLLGEILESGIYTKYLLEAWISWRANVQMSYSPSSFSVIPNNYFDRLRVKCIDTFVRHCLQEEDKYAEYLLENLIFDEIIHRMGSLVGNSSSAIVYALSSGMFIHPRLLSD